MRSQQRYTTLKWVTAALLLIHLLSRATLSYPISIGSEQVKVGVSIGLAPTEPSGDGSESLRRADLAMYEAKRSKSGVMVWESK